MFYFLSWRAIPSQNIFKKKKKQQSLKTGPHLVYPYDISAHPCFSYQFFFFCCFPFFFFVATQVSLSAPCRVATVAVSPTNGCFFFSFKYYFIILLHEILTLVTQGDIFFFVSPTLPSTILFFVFFHRITL